MQKCYQECLWIECQFVPLMIGPSMEKTILWSLIFIIYISFHFIWSWCMNCYSNIVRRFYRCVSGISTLFSLWGEGPESYRVVVGAASGILRVSTFSSESFDCFNIIAYFFTKELKHTSISLPRRWLLLIYNRS